MSLVLSAYVWFGFRFGLVVTMVFEAAWLWHCVRIWRSNRKRASHSTLKKLLKKPLRRRSTVHTAIRSVNGLMGNLCAYTPNVSLRSNDARWNKELLGLDIVHLLLQVGLSVGLMRWVSSWGQSLLPWIWLNLNIATLPIDATQYQSPGILWSSYRSQLTQLAEQCMVLNSDKKLPT